jgi:hypothetical protein
MLLQEIGSIAGGVRALVPRVIAIESGRTARRHEGRYCEGRSMCNVGLSQAGAGGRGPR